jgi:transaldolase
MGDSGVIAMTKDFFADLVARTPTRVWVNNPTSEELDLALAKGARGCTTNPSYAGGLLRRAPEEVRPVIAECLRISDDDGEVAYKVQMRLVARIAERFGPLYEESGGQDGYVSIQGSPFMDHESDLIRAEARAGRTIAPNATPKLPATAAGLDALEAVVADGSPVIVTEVFSISQLVETCERYLRTTTRTGTRPPFFISPITGIFGDHLKALARENDLRVAREDMELVGLMLGRECQRIVQERSYPVTLLMGGARIPIDLTGMVGAPVHVTINWSTFVEMTEDPRPLELGAEQAIETGVLERLYGAFPDVTKAFSAEGLSVEEYEAFGPVQHFRNNFVAGWNALLGAISEMRATPGSSGGTQ